MKIACVGGGTGLYTLLTGLKHLPNTELSAIVTMADSGGSTGKLRDEFGYLPAGDIRRAMIALSEAPQELRNVMEYRFTSPGSLHEHVVGNIILTALTESSNGDSFDAYQQLSRILRIKGNVYPVTTDNVQLVATLANGDRIYGETNIDVPKHDGTTPIACVHLEPKATIFPKTAAVIRDADFVIIGPGDLYTSIMPNIAVEGFVAALHDAQEQGTRIIYVTNTMTKFGETNNYTARTFVEKISASLGDVKLDAIIANQNGFTDAQITAYAQEGAQPVYNDLVTGQGQILIADHLVSNTHFARHDPYKLANAIRKATEKLLIIKEQKTPHESSDKEQASETAHS